MSLVHVYACCPSALLAGIGHFFGPKKGRFLDPFPFTRPRCKRTWANRELNETEKREFIEIIVRLNQDGSIQKSLPNEAYISDNKIISLISELNKEKTNLTMALVGRANDISSKSDRIHTISDYKDKGLFDLGPTQISQTPKAFFDHIPSFIIQPSKRFKLIDPYFFDLKKEANTPKRLMFIKELIDRYYSSEENKNSYINIDIYGKCFGFNHEYTKEHFAKYTKMLQTNLPFIINFYILKEKNNFDDLPQNLKEFEGKKIHERFFCADRFNFSFEDSIMDRSIESVKQTWRYEATDGMIRYIDCYNENPKLFDLDLHFDSKQLEFISQSIRS